MLKSPRKYFVDNSYGDYVRSHPGRTMLMAFIVILVIMIYGAYVEMSKMWYNQEPAYPVKNEYFTSLVLGGMKSYLLNKKGWSEDNIIVKVLEIPTGWAYRSAKRKIPKDDGELLLFEFMYKIHAFIPRERERLRSMRNDIVNILIALLDDDLKIKNKWMRENYRYLVLDRMIFAAMLLMSNFDVEGEYSLNQEIIDKTITLFQNDYDEIFNLLDHRLDIYKKLPISFAETILEHSVGQIFITNKNYQFLALERQCSDSTTQRNIRYLRDITNKLEQEVIPIYESRFSVSDEDQKEYVLYVKDRVSFIKKEAMKKLKDECQIEL